MQEEAGVGGGIRTGRVRHSGGGEASEEEAEGGKVMQYILYGQNRVMCARKFNNTIYSTPTL